MAAVSRVAAVGVAAMLAAAGASAVARAATSSPTPSPAPSRTVVAGPLPVVRIVQPRPGAKLGSSFDLVVAATRSGPVRFRVLVDAAPIDAAGQPVGAGAVFTLGAGGERRIRLQGIAAGDRTVSVVPVSPAGGRTSVKVTVEASSQARSPISLAIGLVLIVVVWLLLRRSTVGVARRSARDDDRGRGATGGSG